MTMQHDKCYLFNACSAAAPPKAASPRSRVQTAILSALGIGLLAASLAACAPTGPEPVALDQNPGSNGAPTASTD
jgi:hypothetical protein